MAAGYLLIAALASSPGALGCVKVGRTADLLLDPDPRVVYRVETTAPLVALTIDDGPDADETPRILDVLARHGARATFFLIGSQVAGNEALVQRILDEGHEIGNHGMQDRPAIELGAAFGDDVDAAERVLGPFQPLRWYRPGGAFYDEAMLEALAERGYTGALGSSYPLDAQVPSFWWSYAWLRLDVEPGDVIVLHDREGRGTRTARVLDRLLPALARRGLHAVTLSRLTGPGVSP